MQDLAARIGEALAKEEERAERFANNVRLVFLAILTAIAVVNAFSLTAEANLLNVGALLLGYVYGLLVYALIRIRGYHPSMKYATSCLDVVLIMLLLLLYTTIEIPSVALKNYVFLVVFPAISLTAFRYDRRLTLVAGGLAIALYLALILYLYASGLIVFTAGGYERELFSGEITYIGQTTKVLILAAFVVLVAYLAQYSRALIATLVREEMSVRNQQELTEWELTLASQVQSRLLPRAFPVVEGLDIYGEVQQGRFVGGDYCDIIKMAEDRLLVVVADVAGKGIPAALIMAEVRASTHVISPAQIDLVEYVRRVNDLLYESTDKKTFVTCCAVEIDTARRRISYVNAGHPSPMIWSGGELRFLSKRTIPLGMRPELPQLSIGEEPFTPGGVFVSYTDGLVEQMDPEGGQYGEGRLINHVQAGARNSAQSLATEVLKEVKSFAQSEQFNDDVSIAVVRFLERH